jgi:hypothetical protein
MLVFWMEQVAQNELTHVVDAQSDPDWATTYGVEHAVQTVKLLQVVQYWIDTLHAWQLPVELRMKPDWHSMQLTGGDVLQLAQLGYCALHRTHVLVLGLTMYPV